MSQYPRYLRAARRAFATVPFYREQWATAGEVLDEPRPTPTTELPDPPHTLCPFSRPWSAAREPSLWTPDVTALIRALRLTDCHDGTAVLEVRGSLLDRPVLPRSGRPRRRASYRVLLGPHAMVASPQRRRELNDAVLAEVAGLAGWVVGGPDELAGLPEAVGDELRPVHRLSVGRVAEADPDTTPTLLHDATLGYVGALVPDCGRFHLDWRRVYARDRGGVLTFSLLHRRRPTLLALVPPGAEAITVAPCSRHTTPVLCRR